MLLTRAGGLLWGLVILVLVVGGLALVAGTDLSRTDLLNQNTSSAKARQIDVRTEIEARKGEIEVRAHEVSKNLELQAQGRRLAQELELERWRAEQEMELSRLSRYGLLAVAAMATLSLGVGGAVYLARCGEGRLLAARAQASDPATRVRERRQARHLAIVLREALRSRRPAPGGDGSEPAGEGPVPVKSWPQGSPAHSGRRGS